MNEAAAEIAEKLNSFVSKGNKTTHQEIVLLIWITCAIHTIWNSCELMKLNAKEVSVCK